MPQPVILQMTQGSVTEQRGPPAPQGKASQERRTATQKAGPAASPQGSRIWSGKSRWGSGPETVSRVGHSPAITHHGARQVRAQPGSLVRVRVRMEEVMPEHRRSCGTARCRPGGGWRYGHRLNVAPMGKERQGLPFTVFATALTGNKTDRELGQLNSLTQLTNLPEGGCAPGPENKTVLVLY